MNFCNWRYLKIIRLRLLLACLTIYCLLIFIYSYVWVHTNKYCFDDEIDDGILNILNQFENLPPKGKSIFFHETSCGIDEDNILQISPRQACAVESAAKHNPNSTIYLLYASPVKFPNDSMILLDKYKVLRALFKYNNVKIRRVLFETYVENTPLEGWYKSGKLKMSQYTISHASDVLRYLTLWKFGGTHLDLDIVLMRNLEKLPPNYAGAEDKQNVAVGAVNFDFKNEGHTLADLCLREILNNFNGDDWGHNGPGVLTRVLKRTCKVDKTKLMNPERCKGFKVYQPKYFYPINWRHWQLYFDPDKIAVALNATKDSFMIHVWNNFSTNKIIFTKYRDVAYSAVARINCPHVFNASGEVF